MAKVKADVRDLIMAHLKADSRRLSWLADKTKFSYGHLYFVLVRKERELTDVVKEEINTVLNTNF